MLPSWLNLSVVGMASERSERVAVVLFNLGGPDNQDAVAPFLFNLFSDPAILRVPAIVRRPLAKFIARRRMRVAQSGVANQYAMTNAARR